MEFNAESSVLHDVTLSSEHNALLYHQEHSSEIELVSLGNRNEIARSWIRDPSSEVKITDVKYISLGCFSMKKKVLIRWIMLAVLILIFLGIPAIIKFSKHKNPKAQPIYLDEYSKAVRKTLLFFNAQKSGKLPKNNGIQWREDSALKEEGDLVGGYYDAGNNIKYHFPMAFSVTLLSWSVIEYSYKYKAIGEYEHVIDIIRWGSDYLLKTFNSNATDINFIYSQVGIGRNASIIHDDQYCWTRPEDMDYPRPVTVSLSAPDLGGEIAAALAAASIVFRDDAAYHIELIKGASIAYRFARRKRFTYSYGIIDNIYNSSGYWDEYLWSAAWNYYATGDKNYALFGTDARLAKNAKIHLRNPDVSILSWDNKLPAAILLWTRLRMLMDPGYPYEESLKLYQETVELNMCSYMRKYKVFNWTKGGLIQLNHGDLQTLQYVVNVAFLANLYSDYMNAIDVPGFYCGQDYFNSTILHTFASSQLKYIMGKNPRNISYIVGHGTKYPQHVHHRGASIPNDGVKYSCRDGVKWRDSKNPNPNKIVGAMVGGPDRNDDFVDTRVKQDYTEPTLAGNAGLVAALISMTDVGGRGIDKDTIFGAIPSMFPEAPPPPEPWNP